MTATTSHVSSRCPGTPMYGLGRAMDGSWERIGGPFADVDDLLDCCFDYCMDHDLSPRDVQFVETIDGRELQREFPRGALPEPDDLPNDGL